MNGKLRNYVIGLLAVALIGALGYWNIRPESFMERQATAESGTRAIVTIASESAACASANAPTRAKDRVFTRICSPLSSR